ncbi:MAG: hypothetical protein IPL26_21620 [Leptospiraceae bacterium]|nr:hypothetical protein [Leptospiraceae bacterium]
MKKILKKFSIALTGFLLLAVINCGILFKEKDDAQKNRNLVALGILAELDLRVPGIYVSGKLVEKDGVTPIPNSTITITGRGESAAINRSGTPIGFYQNVLSTGASPVTLYGNISGIPSLTTRDAECGTALVTMYSPMPASTRVICDSTALDVTAKSFGVSDSLIALNAAAGTITSGADGSFTSAHLPNAATGNTYNLAVNGKTKTRRFRLAKSGTATLLDGSNDRYLGSSNGDPIIGTSASTNEGTSSTYDFTIVDLQVEIVYPKPYAVLSGTINENLILSPGRDYLLSGTVIIPSGVTLTIAAGTKIYGATSPAGALLIKKGGRIDAQGTASNPVVFSSEKSIGSRSGGDWQGIIIQGNGIQTFGGYGATAVGEGDVGTFGGNNDSDNSGIMRYVRIEFAGAPFSPGNERNCLSLMGVGSGTTLEYIQCHRGFDDGFEIWGGAVNLKHLVSSGNRDDQFDYADGWIGRLQFAIGHIFAGPTASNDDTSRCVEGDGNSANTCSGSKKAGGTCADPSIGNVTCVSFSAGQNIGDAIFVRRANGGKAGEFSHFHILNFGAQNSSDCASAGQTASLSTVAHTYIVSTAGNNGCTTTGNTDQVGVTLTSVSESTPNYMPSAANTTNGTANINVWNSNFNSATYYGAIENAGTDWTGGWTSYPSN